MAPRKKTAATLAKEEREAAEKAATDRRNAEIRADAHSGRNWASEAAYGAACLCGAGLRTLTAAFALKGVHGAPTGRCPRHPGGTVIRKPEGTIYEGENGA